MPRFYNVHTAVGLGTGVVTYKATGTMTIKQGGSTTVIGPGGSYTVGSASAPNRHDDVMLVQFFLKRLFDHEKVAFGPLPLDIDGFCGPITVQWIQNFQRMLKQKGNPTSVDGRIDRAEDVMSSISKTIYAIVQLNAKYKFHRPDLFDHIEFDPQCPPLLAAALAAS
jgi:hypothetical protein